MSSTLSKGSEAAFDLHCDLCYKDNTYVEAIGYCVDCADYLCQECYNHHLKPRPMRHHVLLDQYSMPKDTSQRQNKDMYTEQCATHNRETLTYHCANHDQLCCSVCITLNHLNCEGVNYIPDIAGDVLTSREYRDMILKVKTLTKTTQQAVNTIQIKTKTTNQQHYVASEFFKQMKKDLVAAVDRLETSFMKDAGKIRDENQKKIKYVKDQSNKLLKEIGALVSKFTSLENKGQHCNIFFSMKRSQDEIVALETSLLQLQDQSNITEYVIKISDDLQHLIRHPLNMASLEIIYNQQRSLSQSASKVLYCHTKTTQKKAPGNTLGQHVANIEVRMKNERRNPWNTGSVALPGEKLVVDDFYNNTVKLIDLRSNKIVSHIKHDGKPFDITAVTNTQVAVTCPYDGTILYINVTNTLTLDHKVKVNGQCWGIACISDKLVITYTCPVKVEILSKKGKLLQTVVTEDIGEQLFSSPWHMAASPDQQTIYISDWDRATVTSLDLNGKVKAKYEDDELNYPRGLTVDRGGVLYVCGLKSNNIHQLTPDLHNIQILLQESDGIEQPTSVSYNEERNKLYIGMWLSDIVKVYML